MNEFKTFKNYVNGQWIGPALNETFEQRNPAKLSQVTGIFPLSSKEDTLLAIEAAQSAFTAWKALSPIARGKYLHKALALMTERREDIAGIITQENGKIITDSLGEIDSAIAEMDFQINQGLRLFGETIPVSLDGVFAYTLKEPLGVVSIICPWNFPFNVAVRKCIPAMMAGNTCIFKPASLTPQTGYLYAKLFDDAGLPAGVFNMVTGSGREVGNTLVTDIRIKAISFTGSTEVGMGIHQKAAINGTRTQLELGGKNAALILEDADIDLAVKAIVRAAFACSGQWCTSTSRAIVVKKVAVEFTQKLIKETKSIVVGDGFDASVTMGPVCGTDQVKTILEYIEIGKKEGAKLLAGGNKIDHGIFQDGCFIEPTIFGSVKPNMRVAQEEIFGPVLSVIVVDSLDEAIQVANDSKFGLSSSVFTNNLNHAMRFVRETAVGFTHVNLMTSLKEPQLPFGGIKESGIGLPEAGKSGLDFFSNNKSVYIKY
ncbi:MAG: aldehyde dehydrogenase family protein [Lentimicrobiaceae bacterium]|nr:aldehyde dehydrogenase family protein [Lentimicrobiaceae bacterium]